MFDFWKRKDKEKPEPTCYLFIGAQQCVGGFPTVWEAIEAAAGEENPEAKITSDMAGNEILYRFERSPFFLPCGCEYLRVGWGNNDDYQPYQRPVLVKHCGDLSAHYQPQMNSAINTLPFEWRNSTGLSIIPNGDPLS